MDPSIMAVAMPAAPAVGARAAGPPSREPSLCPFRALAKPSVSSLMGATADEATHCGLSATLPFGRASPRSR
eukprot:5411695-Alexandrium_andersonii.AAC.1